MTPKQKDKLLSIVLLLGVIALGVGAYFFVTAGYKKAAAEVEKEGDDRLKKSVMCSNCEKTFTVNPLTIGNGSELNCPHCGTRGRIMTVTKGGMSDDATGNP